MKKFAGSVLVVVMAVTLLLVAPPSGLAGGRSHVYVGGSFGKGYHGHRGDRHVRGYHGFRHVHGRWAGHRHSWGPRWGVHFNWRGPVWWGPWPAPFGYYSPPPVIVQQQPPVYVQPEPEATDYWYYCQNPQGYYPYIRSCPGGWMRVVPETTPPNP